MKSFLASLIIIMCGASVAQGALAGASPTDAQLTAALDSAMSGHAENLLRKEQEINSLRDLLGTRTKAVDRSVLLGDLFGAYLSNNADSAIAYAARRLDAAYRSKDKLQIDFGRLNSINILSLTGSYTEAVREIKALQADGIHPEARPYYYHIMRLTFGNMADYAVREEDRALYRRLTDQYRDSILSVNPLGTVTHTVVRADALNAHGQYAEAAKLLENYMAGRSLREHDRAILAYTLAEAYRGLKNRPAEKHNLLIASIADLKSGVREYVAPRKLAMILYEEGDIERAYRLMRLCLDDAVASKSRQRVFEINEVFPMVNKMYIDRINAQQRRLTVMITLIALMAVLLGVSLVFVYKQMKRARYASSKLEEANTKLRSVNAKLTAAKAAVEEESLIKNEYLSTYMEQCLANIDTLSAYRKQLRLQLATGKLARVTKDLDSDAMIDRAFKEFYADFDSTFLRLFPTFIDEFNALLTEPARIVPHTEGSLTPALRIYALIRLGVTESASIAKFLRYSNSTIYNYRTRLRNAAACPRDEFEARVTAIGTEKG